MISPQYAILLDGGFVTKKLYERNGRAATAEDVEVECERIKQLPCVADYELLRIYYYDAPPSDETVAYPVSGNRLCTSPAQRVSEKRRACTIDSS